METPFQRTSNRPSGKANVSTYLPAFLTIERMNIIALMSSHGRAVKAIDYKSIGFSPRRFESCLTKFCYNKRFGLCIGKWRIFLLRKFSFMDVIVYLQSILLHYFQDVSHVNVGNFITFFKCVIFSLGEICYQTR